MRDPGKFPVSIDRFPIPIIRFTAPITIMINPPKKKGNIKNILSSMIGTKTAHKKTLIPKIIIITPSITLLFDMGDVDDREFCKLPYEISRERIYKNF